MWQKVVRSPGGYWVLALILLLAACGGGVAEEGRGGEPVFVVTIHPLKAILAEVAGDRAGVVRILAPGASPHTHDPRPSDVRQAERALALFYVDPALDGWAAQLRRDRLHALLPMVHPELLLQQEDHQCDGGHDHRHGEDEPDPHFWTDPLVVKSLLPDLAGLLTRYDPEGEAEYHANAEAFAGVLEELHGELAEKLAPVAGEKVVLFHPSFRYMLERYGLEYAGVIEPSPGREATPRYLQGLIRRFEEENIKAVFSEPQLSQRPVEVIGEGTGRPVFMLDPVGGVPGRESYSELLRYNAEVLRTALE